MEENFKRWLVNRGYLETGAANSYSRAIPIMSEHYSKETGIPTDIYAITDQAKISQIAHEYSQAGKFSAFGNKQHGRFRAAISRYSEFYVHNNDTFDVAESSDTDKEVSLIVPSVAQTNFAYERDLQTTLCAQISELFPEYKIFGDFNLGVEYSIGGKRIDVLLEHLETKNLLVIELKSGMADNKVFGQIAMYIGLLQKQFPDKKINGVIVAGSIDDGLRFACEISNRISLKIYRMSIELEDV